MICPGVISIGMPRPGVTGLSSELEANEGGDGEHVGGGWALEAIIGEEETIEDEAVEFEFVVVVIMRLLELFRFVFELFVFCCGILVAVELGMTRVGLVEAVAVVLVVTTNKNVYLQFKKKRI